MTVITPTLGSGKLHRAVESVQAQSYSRLDHLIVVDGPEGEASARSALPTAPRRPCHLIPVPFKTGAEGFNALATIGWIAADGVDGLPAPTEFDPTTPNV